jgi:hypothetical protein
MDLLQSTRKRSFLQYNKEKESCVGRDIAMLWEQLMVVERSQKQTLFISRVVRTCG